MRFVDISQQAVKQQQLLGDLEVNAYKTKHMAISQDQSAGRSHDMKTDNSSFERVEQFKYLGTSLIIKNLFRKKLKTD
jgi:hypothetical protein